MLILTIVLFSLAVLFGLILLTRVLKNKPTPPVTILSHGIFAVLALIILAAAIIGGQRATLLLSSLTLFVLAGLGGFTLLAFYLYRNSLPKLILLIHPLIALTAFTLLIMYVISQYNAVA